MWPVVATCFANISTILRTHRSGPADQSLTLERQCTPHAPHHCCSYKHVPTSIVGQPSSQEKSLLTARKVMTLLKNDGGLLPLPLGKNVAVVGQAMNSPDDYTGNYNGPLCPSTHSLGSSPASSCWPGIFDMVSAMNNASGGRWATPRRQAQRGRVSPHRTRPFSSCNRTVTGAGPVALTAPLTPLSHAVALHRHHHVH